MIQIECTFKLAYTATTFVKIIDITISPYDLKSQIQNDVLENMGLDDFNIILAGTRRAENNDPIDCNIRNKSIALLVGRITNQRIVFYIKPINEEAINIIEDPSGNIIEDPSGNIIEDTSRNTLP
jgi:hypothetical protein